MKLFKSKTQRQIFRFQASLLPEPLKNELIEETIKLIDDIYKKGRYTKERWKRVEDRLDIFRKHTFAENHLSVVAVDPYCLYSEGNKNIPAFDFFTMR